VACRNLDEKEWKVEQWKGGRGTPNVVFERKAPWKVRNVQTDPSVRDPEFFRRHGLVSYLGIPLIVKDEILGVISFYTKEEHEFSHEDIEFLTTLAGQAAIAIHNSQLYEESREQAVELEKAIKVKDEFLSVMSHELRTPLNVVMGYAGMIKDRMLGEINREQERALGKIVSRSRDLLSMIIGILEATRIEAEEVKVESQKVNLVNFLGELRLAYDVPLDKELDLIWDYSLELPAVKTDSEKLKQILQNLINNAMKFTEKGSVKISARYLPDAEVTEFKVADTGIGINKESFPVIFEKFRQLDSSETRPYGGVGMGLYIVKKFTELLGGEVEVESEVGKGSTFTVTIPCDGQKAIGHQQSVVSQQRPAAEG
jgi:signal transduction histidine kinase